jgi:SAM-dependent methyltransferase
MNIFSSLREKIPALIAGIGKGNLCLVPIISIDSRVLFERVKSGEHVQKDILLCKDLIQKSNLNFFTVHGFCIPCKKKTEFIVDAQFGGEIKNGILSPNWRERMECKYCRMNNRQRLIAGLIIQKSKNKRLSIYFMEQVTPIYLWATKYLGSSHRITGSEYLGYEYKGGEIINGIQHENIEMLSFKDNEFDMIISNDVFEHVPNPDIAFKECCRVLKPGGEMLATIPFYDNYDFSIKRAVIKNNQIINLLAPQFHGNPLSEKGSLVFNDFGWDLLSTMKLSGFNEANIELFLSEKYGHIGQTQLIFKLVK